MSDYHLYFPMTHMVLQQGLLHDHPMTLIDVGASGGIQDQWKMFDNDLVAYCFEPWLAECERLNQTSALKNVHYYPYFVGKEEGRASDSFLRDRKPDSVTAFGRSSCFRAESLLGRNYLQHNQQVELTFSEISITLDRFVKDHAEIQDIDFIKIDTDGSDLEVLLGAEKILERFNVVGLKFEANFHTTSSPMFCELDRFCRSYGYSLFDLLPHRHSRAQLPLKFVADTPTTTIAGQVIWADVMYFRDPCSAQRPFDISKLLKLVCIFELYGFPDCAAELLVLFRENFDRLTGGTTEQLLDALTPSLNLKKYSFREYNQQFEKNLSQFLFGGSNAEYYKRQLAQVYASNSWKVTAPLRWFSYILKSALKKT
jgi:FkbM family methyltransferase